MNRSTMNRKLMVSLLAIAALACFFPAPVFAYVGPGAALSLLGALWGMVVAVGAAVAFAVAWPLRRFLRQRKERRAEKAPVHPTGPHPAAEA